MHITLRLAWHNDGWNGRVCHRPESNTYCVGCHSYPGELIREKRDLAWEKANAGKLIAELDRPPACMYSASAFSDRPNRVFSEPPEFFNDDTRIQWWEIPAATACTWPYEAMYNRDDVRDGDRYDYDKRLKYAEQHFEPVESGRSLVFYYANYSNPLSEEEHPRYLLVGVARIKEIAPIYFYESCSPRTLERYKGFIWQRGVTSDYPMNGVRLPYHRYVDQPDQLRKFAVTPENVGLCKYATRQVSDDDALALLEQLVEAVRIVRDDLKDNSENWSQRIEWLEQLIAQLWRSRGAYPGIPAVLDYLGLNEAISGFREFVNNGKEQDAVGQVRGFISGKSDSIAGVSPLKTDLPAIRREIRLELEDRLELFIETFGRCALNAAQVAAIVDERREGVGIAASLDEIHANPDLIAEQYTGVDQSDAIAWSAMDRGMLPSPELSAQPRFKKNAPERLRALLLDTLRRNPQQTFVRASDLLNQVNHRMQALPEWKQNLVSEKYLAADRELYEAVIRQREEAGINYLYDQRVWEDERLVEQVLGGLLDASDVQLKKPIDEGFWRRVLFKENSALAKKARAEYENAVSAQREACEKIVSKRCAAVTGGAGTGKTTIVAALIKAIRKIHGEGVGVAVIAPTGKATDRLRGTLAEADLSSVSTSTIHSILARHGWLNDNLTFRRQGGKRLTTYSTIIIDESSMIDITLMAALFRAIDWSTVRQLFLVGDAAQLPPIGVGRAYADVIGYLRKAYPEHLIQLEINLRQMENRAEGRGILSVADCFINSAVRDSLSETEERRIARETLVQSLHVGGDIDKDLHVIYWSDPEELQRTLIDTITRDLRTDEMSEESAARVRGNTLKDNVNCMQILSPVRGELHGTDAINLTVQKFKSDYWLKKGAVDGITLFDKVIQIVNRPASKPLWGFDFKARGRVKVEVFNGEIGTVVPTGSWDQIKNPSFKLFGGFSVKFTGKEHISVNYGKGDKPEANLELAYAISVHKAQGSEFSRVYFVLPKSSSNSARMMELIYTGITRASTHCTILIQDSVETLVNAMRPEQSALQGINSSLFGFHPVKDALANLGDWYEAGRIHQALTGDMVRSKSEVIIANLLHERGMSFWYEKPLLAPDGTLYLPDFTLQHQGEMYYWEHVGMLSKSSYKAHWDEKRAWYEKHFSGRLLITEEGPELSRAASQLIEQLRSRRQILSHEPPCSER